jgi:HEAT repeat protein
VAMKQVVGSPSAAVRAKAVMALARMGHSDESVVPIVTEMLKDPSPEVRASAEKALAMLQTHIRGLKASGSPNG